MNVFVKLFLLLFLTLKFIDGLGQYITFQKIYGIGPREEIGLSVVQTSTLGYMVVGEGYNCLHTDQYGDTLWTGRVPAIGRCIQRTFDNNFVITSYEYPIIKFDINGNVLWNRNSYRPFSFPEYISETSDRGFILSGGILKGSNLFPYILKTDSLGYFKWDKVFDSYNLRTAIEIVQTSDLGYVFTGIDTGAYAMKLDSSGNFIWYRNYKAFLSSATSIVEKNNGFLICGKDKLLRLNDEGGVIWIKTYSLGINRETSFNKLINTEDNGFALTGVRDTTGEEDFAPLTLLLKTDSSGNQLFYKLFGIQNSFNDYNSGRDIRQTNDSGYIIAGIIDTNSLINNPSDNHSLFGGDLLLVKTDKLGEISTGVLNNDERIPMDYDLHQNYPNPFNPRTKIKFDIPTRSFITLKIYDILGKEISTLVYDFKDVGVYEVEFDGQSLSSGIYIYRIVTKNKFNGISDFALSKRMLFIK